LATVLVVDDSTANRELVRALLDRSGHRVLDAAAGSEALDLARRESPDLVITDVLMPGLDGYELARRLRDEPSTRPIPIAFYTAHYDDKEVRSLAAACGVQRVILKSSQPAELLNAVEDLLDQGPTPLGPVSEEEFARRHADTLLRKLVEKSADLERSENRFQVIAQSAPIGILLGDSLGRAVYVNPHLSEIIGRAPVSLLGAGWMSCLSRAQHGEVRALVRNGPLAASYRHRSRIERDGSPRWLDIHLRPISDESGQAGFIGLFTDVTAAVAAEQYEQAQRRWETDMLRRTADLAHRLTEAQRLARSGTWELDVPSGMVTLSAELARLVGLDDLSEHRISLRRLIHPDDRARLAAQADEAIRRWRPFTTEYRMIGQGGSVREVAMFAEPMSEPDGGSARTPRMWGVIQDVTDMRDAERAADQARADRRAEHERFKLFQAAMLPDELPSVPRAQLASTYLAAADRLDIGGDWYDAFALPDGRVLLSVGDVIGHDHHAATTMGPLRVVLRSYAVEDPDPARMLGRINRFLLTGYPPGTLVTAVVAVYDPSGGRLEWANAGHPAPATATVSREPEAPAKIRFLSGHGPLLGAVEEAEYTTRSITLPPGTALYCYTDGLVERRPDAGGTDPARLIRAIRHGLKDTAGDGLDTLPPARRLVERVTAEMLAGEPPEDDVCVLVLWLLPDGPYRTIRTLEAPSMPPEER
jgi:phosphoserine phosphatase RsbU/P